MRNASHNLHLIHFHSDSMRKTALILNWERTVALIQQTARGPQFLTHGFPTSTVCRSLVSTPQIHIWMFILGGRVSSGTNLHVAWKTEKKGGGEGELFPVLHRNILPFVQRHVWFQVSNTLKTLCNEAINVKYFETVLQYFTFSVVAAWKNVRKLNDVCSVYKN